MKIIVTGTRGIPNILGGVETHCQELYPRIAELGNDVTIIRRSSYIIEENKISNFQGVKLKDIYAPRKKSIEAIVHTFLAVLWAKRQKPDVIHIHAIGPSLMVPFARILGLKVVITNHGPDYDRQKWGKLPKLILKTGERFGAKFANKVIVISEVINSILKKKYKRNDCSLIYNGVNIPVTSGNTDYLDELGISKSGYIVALGRFVEEKGFHDLIKAYANSNIKEYKLVLAGDADHETTYSKELKKQAKESGVVLTGFIKGEKLKQVFSNAALFVMPSYHEGLPIALLEAMSYNLNVLVSNIPANLEVGLESNKYFTTGNIEELSLKIKEKLNSAQSVNYLKIIEEKYNWNTIAKQTIDVYKSVVAGKDF